MIGQQEGDDPGTRMEQAITGLTACAALYGSLSTAMTVLSTAAAQASAVFSDLAEALREEHEGEEHEGEAISAEEIAEEEEAANRALTMADAWAEGYDGP
jgi:hypothetical protein